MNRKHKFTQVIALFLCIQIQQHCYASEEFPYIGIQLGVANTHQGEFVARHLERLVHKVVPSQSLSSMNIFFTNTGLGGRAYVGYQFNTYFAMEVGYSQFKAFDLKANANINVGLTRMINELVDTHNFAPINIPLNFNATATINTYVVDIAGKLILPLYKGFSIYGKLGAAYVNADANIHLFIDLSDLNIGLSSNPSINIVYPEFGLGVSYAMTQHFIMDLSWLHVQKYNGKAFPNIDFVAFGLLYHWL